MAEQAPANPVVEEVIQDAVPIVADPAPNQPAPQEQLNDAIQEFMLIEMAKCQKCLESLKNGIVLPCLHTCCADCLRQSMEHDQIKDNKVHCETCMKRIDVPAGGIKDFLIDLLGNALSGQINPDDNLKCDLCPGDDRKRAVARCLTCGILLCDECSEGHKQLRKSKHHKIEYINLSKVRIEQAGKESAVIVGSKILRCNVHNKKIDRYCSSCKLNICTNCGLEHHKSHQVVSILAKRQVVLASLNQNRVDSRKKCVEIEKKLEYQLQLAVEVATMKQEYSNLIIEHFEALIRHINKQKNQRLQEIDHLAETKIKLIGTTDDELINLENSFEKALEFSGQIISTNNDGIITYTLDFVNLRFQSLLACDIPVTEKINTLIAVNLEGKEAALQAITDSCRIVDISKDLASGKLSRISGEGLNQTIVEVVAGAGKKWRLTITCLNHLGEVLQTGSNKVKVNVEKQVAEGEAPVQRVEVPIENHQDGNYIAGIDAEQVGKYRVHVTVDGEVLAIGVIDLTIK